MLLLFHEKFRSVGRAMLRRWQVSHFFLLNAILLLFILTASAICGAVIIIITRRYFAPPPPPLSPQELAIQLIYYFVHFLPLKGRKSNEDK